MTAKRPVHDVPGSRTGEWGRTGTVECSKFVLADMSQASHWNLRRVMIRQCPPAGTVQNRCRTPRPACLHSHRAAPHGSARSRKPASCPRLQREEVDGLWPSQPSGGCAPPDIGIKQRQPAFSVLGGRREQLTACRWEKRQRGGRADRSRPWPQQSGMRENRSSYSQAFTLPLERQSYHGPGIG
eukprot:scaffold5321_cov366-Prasinococcus_capsulatus_cf.AAC.4